VCLLQEKKTKGIALEGKLDSCSQLSNYEVVVRENGTLHCSPNVSYTVGKFYCFHLPFSFPFLPQNKWSIIIAHSQRFSLQARGQDIVNASAAHTADSYKEPGSCNVVPAGCSVVLWAFVGGA